MAKKEPYKDWIVRYYGSHNDIPPGHTDGELTELIRCKDCKYYTGKWCTKFSTKQIDINDICRADNDFCSRAERRNDETD